MNNTVVYSRVSQTALLYLPCLTFAKLSPSEELFYVATPLLVVDIKLSYPPDQHSQKISLPGQDSQRYSAVLYFLHRLPGLIPRSSTSSTPNQTLTLTLQRTQLDTILLHNALTAGFPFGTCCMLYTVLQKSKEGMPLLFHHQSLRVVSTALILFSSHTVVLLFPPNVHLRILFSTFHCPSFFINFFSKIESLSSIALAGNTLCMPCIVMFVM